MSRIRHCACAHAPTRADQFVAWVTPIIGPLNDAQFRMATAYFSQGRVPPAPAHYWDRALAQISAPDAHGHQRWTGPVPPGRSPHVQYQGRRLPVAHVLWLISGRPDISPLVRTCHDPQCIAPDHHALPRGPEPFPISRSRLLEDFDARNPRVNYRPKKWDRSDHTGERCLRGGHPLTIYGDPRLRNAYCAQCFAIEKNRLAQRKEVEDQVRRETSDNVRSRERIEYDGSAPSVLDIPEPTLSDEVERMFAGLDQ